MRICVTYERLNNMPKFIAIRVQNGEGCDYTIGCGINYEEVEADNFEDAWEKLKAEAYLDDYESDCECCMDTVNNLRNGESSLESYVIYQVAAERDDMYDNWLDNLEKRARALDEDADTKARREQYESLKKEFE